MEWSLTGCFCGWKGAYVTKFARFSTWVDMRPLNDMACQRGLWSGVTKPIMRLGAQVGEMNESGMKCKES